MSKAVEHPINCEARIVDLERQLAEYQQSEASMGDAYATCISERDEAKEKLEAVREYAEQYEHKHIYGAEILCILKEGNDG